MHLGSPSVTWGDPTTLALQEPAPSILMFSFLVFEGFFDVFLCSLMASLMAFTGLRWIVDCFLMFFCWGCRAATTHPWAAEPQRPTTGVAELKA